MMVERCDLGCWSLYVDAESKLLFNTDERKLDCS